MSTASALDQFWSLSPYTNEIIATGLFGVGYYLYRLFSDKTSQQQSLPPPAKDPIPAQISTPLQTYNQGLRLQLLKQKTINPSEILHQIEIDGLKPDVSTFNTVMDCCFETGNFKQGFWVFDEISANNMSYVKPDIASYNILIKGLCIQRENIPNFEEIFQEIQQRNLKLNLTTFNTIIEYYLHTKDLKSVLKYLQKLKNLSLHPDHITISMLYKCLKDYSFDEIMEFCDFAHELLEENTLFNIQIDTCFQHGEPQRVYSLLQEMKDLDIVLSAMTYGILLKGFGMYKDLFMINQIKEEILKERVDVFENEITMGCLFDALVKCGKTDTAEELLSQFPKLMNNIVIQSTILKGFTKQRNMKKATEIFQKMKENNISPNLITYNSLLECSIQSGNFEKSEEIFKELLQKNQADIITYSSYLKGLLKQGRIQETFELLDEIRKKKKQEIDEVLYNSLLDGLVKAKEPQLALNLYKEMLEDGVNPGVVTYSILMKANYLLGNLNEVFTLFNEMKAKKCKPSLIVYTCVAQTCVKSKKINEMLNFYEEMLSFHISPDEIFLNVFISGLCFNNHGKIACEVLFDSLDRGIRLNCEVYANVLKSLIRCMKKNVNFNGVYNNYKGNFSAEEAHLNLLKLTCLMRKVGIHIDLALYNEIAMVLMQVDKEKYQKKYSKRRTPPKFINRNLRK